MAKDAPDSARKEKKEKKASKHSDDAGVTKKSKKDKKSRQSIGGVDEDVSMISAAAPADEDKENDAMEVEVAANGTVVGALVPFANPLADEKTTKKVLKGVKKAAKHRTLKRGVKEVVKSLRKSTATGTASNPSAIVVLAADISPMDVISHIPVLCEDHNVPYVYVSSRAELGSAGSTKRPTSVVMVTLQQQGAKKKEVDGDEKEDWAELYADLAKTVIKAGRDVRI